MNNTMNQSAAARPRHDDLSWAEERKLLNTFYSSSVLEPTHNKRDLTTSNFNSVIWSKHSASKRCSTGTAMGQVM